MATITHTGTAQTLPGAAAKHSHFTAEVFIDFAIIAGDVTIGTTDTVAALKLLKGTTILAAGCEVLKVEGTNTTAKIEIGDGDDPNRCVGSYQTGPMTADTQIDAKTYS